MSSPDQTIRNEIRDFLLKEFLPGEKPSALADDTPLFGAGILDSISILQFVLFLEKRYGIKLQGPDLGRRHLDTIASAADLVRARSSRGR